MSTPEVVDRPELLTAAWLTAALRAEGHDVTVVAVERTPVGTGQMGESFRLALTFEGDPGAVPTSLIAKLPTPNEALRPLVSGAYRAELSFYRDLAPHLPVRVPDTYVLAAADDHTSFVLLMEDLAPRTQGDQIRGCSPHDAELAVVNLAGLHAGSWCDPELFEIPWLSSGDTASAETLAEVFVGATEIFVDRYRPHLDADDIALLGDITTVIARWSAGRPERFSLVHGDYRLDNLMFPRDPAVPGTPEDEREDGPHDRPGVDDVVALDWQTLSIGLPGRDLAYVLETGLAPEVRTASERELVAAYHRALCRHGVTDYPLDLCFDDYRYGALQGPLITVLGAAYGAQTDRGDEMFLAMIRRSCAAVRDLGTLALI